MACMLDEPVHQLIAGNIGTAHIICDKLDTAQTGTETVSLKHHYLPSFTAGRIAADRPAGPPPIIAISYFMF